MEKNWVGEKPDEAMQAEWATLLASGQITLAEYVGLSKDELYVIAQQAYQLLHSGKLEEARDIYQGLVAADPYDSVFHCHLGSVQLRLGNSEEALKEFDLALQYNLANVDALMGRGEIRLSQGNLKEAVGDLRKAIELDPEGKRASTKRAQAALISLKEMLEKQQNEEKNS
jgi:tetratricopeptide (TPR) repeat protein